MQSHKNSNKSGHLFTVEILLEELSNGIALEKLLQTLNQSEVIKDYKVLSRIELGKLTEGNKTSERSASPAGKSSSSKSSPSTSITSSLIEQVEQLKRENTLVRLTIVKAKGPKYDIPCRILHFDPEQELITTYHVDDKKVYTFKFNEIDNFEIA